MSNMSSEVFKTFGNRLRVRVSGICIENEKVLLVNHQGINSANEFWAPPGGGMEFGQTAKENLVREFLEETGLEVNVGGFLYLNEFVGPPLHAVELFFKVTVTGGKLMVGSDPELDHIFDIIKNVEFKDWQWINNHKGDRLHNLLNLSQNISDLLTFNGYFLQLKNK